MPIAQMEKSSTENKGRCLLRASVIKSKCQYVSHLSDLGRSINDY